MNQSQKIHHLKPKIPTKTKPKNLIHFFQIWKCKYISNPAISKMFTLAISNRFIIPIRITNLNISMLICSQVNQIYTYCSESITSSTFSLTFNRSNSSNLPPIYTFRKDNISTWYES